MPLSRVVEYVIAAITAPGAYTLEDALALLGEAFPGYRVLPAEDEEAVRAAVGEALRGRREKFIIQSHICSVWKNGQYLRTRDLAETKAGFEEMMSLLKTDRIDVGMIHYYI